MVGQWVEPYWVPGWEVLGVGGLDFGLLVDVNIGNVDVVANWDLWLVGVGFGADERGGGRHFEGFDMSPIEEVVGLYL